MDVRSLIVHPDRIDAVVSVGDGGAMRTSAVPGLAPRVLVALPGLRGHRCDNDADRTFAEEIEDTEMPHLLEHVAAELMALSGSPRSLRGETRWDFSRDGHGVFRVSLEYDDDLVCLGAVKAAHGLLARLEAGEEAPDVSSDVERLRSLRAS